MKKYRVSVPYVVWVDVDVQASDDDNAIEVAMEEAYLCGYAGNGSTTKLVGNNIPGSIVEACEEPLYIDEDNITLKPEILKEYT